MRKNPIEKSLRTWFFGKYLYRKSEEEPEAEICITRENPYLPQLREVMEQILTIKAIDYRDFSPIFIDGDDSKQCLEAAKVLSEDLNRLIIFTERAAYFSSFVENMYEEQGLIVEIFSKTDAMDGKLLRQKELGNVVLDFEQPESEIKAYHYGEKLYIPIFKRAWTLVSRKSLEEAQEHSINLDIAVPIGYNTVIVSIDELKEVCPCLDKFERAFLLQDSEVEFSDGFCRKRNI